MCYFDQESCQTEFRRFHAQFECTTKNNSNSSERVQELYAAMHASGSLHRQSILVAVCVCVHGQCVCVCVAARVKNERKHSTVRKSSMEHFFHCVWGSCIAVVVKVLLQPPLRIRVVFIYFCCCDCGCCCCYCC